MAPRSSSLLFVNQHYWPDLASTGQHLTDLCEHLAADGHDVSVLCSRGRYLSGSMEAPKRESHNGVSIHRLDATSFGRSSHLGRLADYASFYAQALWRIARDRSFDYVVTLTTPPLLCTAAWLLRKTLGQRYGIWSMDLHPEAEEAAGMLGEDQLTTRLLRSLNQAGYRNADFVVDLGARMKERLLQQGVAPERLHTIPVWNKKDEIRPIPRQENPLPGKLELEDKFIVMYSGNAGLVHRFEDVLGAMRALRDHPEIYFLFVGGGPRKEEITSFAEKHHISNFQYLDYFPRDQIKYSLSLADVHLLTLREQAAGVAVPGKLYGIMAAGRPVVMVGPEASEPGRAITKHGIGRVIDPASLNGAISPVASLKETFISLYENDDERRVMGERARKVFLDNYEQEVACEQWAHLINRITTNNQTQQKYV